MAKLVERVSPEPNLDCSSLGVWLFYPAGPPRRVEASCGPHEHQNDQVGVKPGQFVVDDGAGPSHGEVARIARGVHIEPSDRLEQALAESPAFAAVGVPPVIAADAPVASDGNSVVGLPGG